MLSARIRNATFQAYNKLNNGGKPQPHEWTVLGSIVLEKEGSLEVVCMATGTKCVGAKSLSTEGFVVNDCHAEVLCRRAFVHYLLKEVQDFRSGNLDCILEPCKEGLRLQVKKGHRFYMYISQSPCGCGSEYPAANGKRTAMEIHLAKQRNSKRVHLEGKVDSDDDDDGAGAGDNDENFHHSGAKPICSSNPDPVGLSTKPGRGDPSRSYSCSDKLCLWNHLGLQGSLLSSLVTPVYLTGIVISGSWDECRMKKALVDRIEVSLPPPFHKNEIQLFRDEEAVPFSESEVMKRLSGKLKMSACGSAIVWNAHGLRESLIAGQGVKLGTNLKKGISLKNVSAVSPKKLFSLYKEIVKGEDGSKTYGEIKSERESYEQAKERLMEEGERTMKNWKRKDRLYYDFVSSVCATKPIWTIHRFQSPRESSRRQACRDRNLRWNAGFWPTRDLSINYHDFQTGSELVE